jgi:hypothetical protein
LRDQWIAEHRPKDPLVCRPAFCASPGLGYAAIQLHFGEGDRMATFVVLTDGIDDTRIAVNLDQIRFVRPWSDGTSIVYFDNDQSLAVRESGENIARLSAKANWAWSQLSRTMIISTHTANERMSKTARATAGRAAFIEHEAMATMRYR